MIKRTRGRPQLDEDEKITAKIIFVRFRARKRPKLNEISELNRAYEADKNSGETISEWARRIILKRSSQINKRRGKR